MGRLVADTYVVLWKHFERQRSNDEDFLASATCGFSVLILLANVAQFALLAFGERLPNGPSWPRPYYWGAGALIILISVGGMNLFLSRHADLQTPERITERWAGLTKGRKAAIVLGIFANLLVLLGVRLATAL